MSTPQPLSSLSDPGSLAKLQILLVPIHSGSNRLSDHVYTNWTSLIKRHTVLRGDELSRSTINTHTRGSTSNPRTRFLPPSSSSSISRGGAPNHVHIVYPPQPPARHLSNLSLVRLSAFPLIVLGIASEEPEAYKVNGLREEDEGDLGAGPSKTPTISTFQHQQERRSLCDCFSDTLADLFPPASPFPLVKRLIVVPENIPSSPTPGNTPMKSRESAQSFARSSGKGRMTEVMFAPSENVDGWMGRLLGEVVGDVLGELGELATALETPAGLKTLSSTLLPSLTSTLPHPHSDNLFPNQSTSNTPVNDLSKPRSSTPVSIPHSHSVDQLSSSSSMGISLSRALTPGGRPTSVGPPSLPPLQTSAIAPQPPPQPPSASSNPFRRSTALSSPFTRSSSSASISSTASSATTTPPLATSTKYTSAPLHGLAGGRLLKLLGDMYLLAGMYSDAIKCFEDGAERCRGVGDVLWEALAREGRAVAGIGEAWEGRDGSNLTQAFPNSPIPIEILTHYLSALACLSRAPLPYPPTILSPSPQAVSGTLSFPSPISTSPGGVGTGEGLLAYLHTGIALRISHFLMIIWASGGWGSIALSALLSHSLPRSFPLPLSVEAGRVPESRRKRHRLLRQLGNQSLLTRHSIFDHAESALGPHSRALTKPEQLAMHVEVVWLARWLDMPRKEACITREVVKRIAVMIVEARDEARRASATGLLKGKSPSSAFSDASVGLGLGMAVTSQAVAVRRKESTDGNTSAVALFERALRIMGIDLLDLGSEPPVNCDEDQKSRFGWPELQVEMMKEGIAIAEALPDNLAIVRFCTSALNVLHAHLNGPSQAHVAKMFSNALSTIRRRGVDLGGLPWWIPGKMVLSLEVVGLPSNRLPVEHSVAEIEPQDDKRDPFLYNPRLRAAEAGKTILVANEQTNVFVTLQNPFAFDLEIQGVSLLTFGVPFNTTPSPISLPPNSMQTVRINGVCSSAGSLQIRGVALRLPDGSSTEIMLPLLSDKEQSHRDKRRSRVIADLSKTKRQGMEARWSITQGSVRDSGEISQKWLEFKIVDEQPLLWIKKTNLTHGTVMLYDGETSTIKITLENSSSTPVDFVKLSFEDSSSKTIQGILFEGEVSSEQAYELEYDMVKRPVFTWNAEGDTAIPPGGRSTLSITCLGKLGCTDGSIRVDYGYLNRLQDDSSEGAAASFQTRQITFPVLFTVYHTLEAYSFDIMRMTSNTGGEEKEIPRSIGFLTAPPAAFGRNPGPNTPRSPSFQTIGDSLLSETLKNEMDDEHCLVGLSVRNVYGVPFELSLSRSGDGHPIVATRLVPPGATERIFLPIPKLILTAEEIARPIPTLSERQYVVDKTKRSAEQIALERETFWYREKLLSTLEASWIEPGSRRSGFMSLRDQYFPPPLIHILRMDSVEIDLSIFTAESGTKRPIRSTDFTTLALTVTNHLDRPFKPFVRIEPLPSSSLDHSWTTHKIAPSRRHSSIPAMIKNVVFDGSLSSILDEIQPGEGAEYHVSAVFLASGEYAFRAAVEEITTGQSEPEVRFSPLLRVRAQ